jgi:hypothetical protein
MTTKEKLKLLDIVCVNSERNEFEFFYDFKLKRQIHNECLYTTHFRIFTQHDLTQDDIRDVLMSLKKLNTIERNLFTSFPYSHRDLIFIENLESKYNSSSMSK